MTSSSATHEVLNQSPPFEDVDLFALDKPLAEAVAANGGDKGIVRVRAALGFG
jgi:putative acyl-CoA dehydrogenase